MVIGIQLTGGKKKTIARRLVLVIWLSLLILVLWSIACSSRIVHFPFDVGSAFSSNTLTFKASTLSNQLGSVLPVRRFRIMPGTGRLLETLSFPPTTIGSAGRNSTSSLWRPCHAACWNRIDCDAWEVDARGPQQQQSSTTKNATTTTNNISSSDSTICRLYANFPSDANQAVAVYQAPENDPNMIIGVVQRRACALRLTDVKDSRSRIAGSENVSAETSVQDRVLYILHFHHPVLPGALDIFLHQVLKLQLPVELMDVVVITPLEEPIIVSSLEGGDASTSSRNMLGSTLVNPFHPVKGETRGTNSHMSLPIVMTHFPGYRGYLLVNDDAGVKVWGLVDTDTWWSDKPWVTFPTDRNGQAQLPRQEQRGPFQPGKSYPYGPYRGWGWWNYRSGETVPGFGVTRVNFDATLAALNSFCASYPHWIPEEHRRAEFCTNRPKNTIPYINGKADIFYAPGNTLGYQYAKTIALFGEHDVMLEIAVPMAYNLLVADKDVLTIPYCDARQFFYRDGLRWRSKEEQQEGTHFSPYYLTRWDSNLTRCPTLHPIKFSNPKMIQYWTNETISGCAYCQERDPSSLQWEVVKSG
jgi:hypothetical protein